ncbi:MAG: aldo/keto reductase [bacterium]|nr:aldo/keto reductase [bacterium]
MNLPSLGMGTWGMGGKFERDESNVRESVEALRFGLTLGLSLIDGAELHGEGLTEEIIGQAIKGVPREKVFLISKVSREHLSFDGVRAACEGSLKRLGVDYIDLYLVHKLPPENPLPQEETFQALLSLLKEGKVRHTGVSNFNVAQLEAAQKFVPKSVLEANQVEYNLLYQEAGKEVIPYCRKHDIAIMAHRPLGKGALMNIESEILDGICKKYNKTRTQVALNWIISQGITAIPKAGSKEHMQENMGALGWEMEEGDIEALRALDGSVPYEKIQ